MQCSSGPRRGFQKDYTPVKWSEYFANQDDVQLDDGTTFRVYKSQVSAHNGPVLFLLHGGGLSALTWSLFSHEMTQMVHWQCYSWRTHFTRCWTTDFLSLTMPAGDESATGLAVLAFLLGVVLRLLLAKVVFVGVSGTCGRISTVSS